VERVDNTLEPAGPALVNRNLAPGMTDAQLVAGDHHAPLSPISRHGTNRRCRRSDHAVSLHLAHQLARIANGGTPAIGRKAWPRHAGSARSVLTVVPCTR